MTPKNRLIWLLEDDDNLHDLLVEMLQGEFAIESFYNIESYTNALISKEINKPILAVVDNFLPDGIFSNFVNSSRFIRYHNHPFILLTGYDDALAIENCYQKGALDYIRKPFDEFEISFKVRYHLQQLKSRIGSHDFYLDPDSFTVIRQDKQSEILTAKEFQIISLLLKESNYSATKEKLIQTLWNKVTVSEKSIRVHFSNLRRKIEPLDLSIEFQNTHYTMIDRKHRYQRNSPS